MNRTINIPYKLYLIGILFISSIVRANDANINLASINNSSVPIPSTPSVPFIIPSPPSLNAKSYILIDVNSGKILAEKNSDQKLPPASLTKMMTLYVISNALKNHQINLDDQIRISHTAWNTGGSRMFLKEGQQASIADLLKGIIVDSGNDACAAIAEHLGGGENGFAEIMNQQAQALGMSHSHFTDSTGLPNPQHYTTAKDLARLGTALINDFPQYYHWYKEKWFIYNGIRQPNRNRLLWRDNRVDGIKTGHTEEAGFCLVSSAKKDRMRLLAVILGSPSETARVDESERLLNYGFRFFETHHLYPNNQVISTLPVYKGKTDKVAIGLNKEQYITIPTGQYPQLKLKSHTEKYLKAPIKKGDRIGELTIEFNNELISTQPLYALADVDAGGLFTRIKDSVRLSLKKWL